MDFEQFSSLIHAVLYHFLTTRVNNNMCQSGLHEVKNPLVILCSIADKFEFLNFHIC